MASTLFIALPTRHVLQSEADWSSLALPFAVWSDQNQLVQQGAQPLAQLQALAVSVKRLTFLLAAADVSLISVQAPPLTPAKLRLALPNLLEEQLIGDPSESVMLPLASQDGKLSVAVCDRQWLQKLAQRIHSWPLRSVQACPAQLAATSIAGECNLLAEQLHGSYGLIARTGQNSGLGMQFDDWAGLFAAAEMIAADQAVNLYVPGAQQAGCQQALGEFGEHRIHLKTLDWAQRLGGLAATPPDLLAEIGDARRSRFEWKVWRTPVLLASAVLALNLLALNLDWLMQKRTAAGLRTLISQTFQASYPNATVLEPVMQMRQNVNGSRRLAGQFASDDLVVMTARFTLAWDKVMAGKPANIAVIDYKDHALNVKPKSLTAVPIDELRRALNEQSLKLDAGPDGVLHISVGSKS